MLLNVTQLLADNSSRDSLALMLSTQHAVLLPINMATSFLNALAFRAVCSTPNLRSLPETLIGSFVLNNLLYGLLSMLVNILYFTGSVSCSGNCEMTFDPYSPSDPGVLVSVLRYGFDACLSIHNAHMMLQAINQLLFIVRPMQFRRLLKRRLLISTLVISCLVCLLLHLLPMVGGIAFRSDEIYFLFRCYYHPVAQATHISILMILYSQLYGTAILQSRRISRREAMHARIRTVSRDRTTQSGVVGETCVVRLMLVGCFICLGLISPALCCRAFRREFPPTLSRVTMLLVVDILSVTYFLWIIIFMLLLYTPLSVVIKGYFREIRNFLCCARTEAVPSSDVIYYKNCLVVSRRRDTPTPRTTPFTSSLTKSCSSF